MNPDLKLFPPELLKAAGMLVPIPENGGTAFSSGRHRSSLRGDSSEFQDFRSYTPGDDLRRLDWNIFLRFRKLLVRQYRNFPRKKHLIIMDDSQSIRFRSCRADLVWRLAALIAGPLLTAGDSVAVQTGESTRRACFSPGRQSIVPLLEELTAGYHVKKAGRPLSFRLPGDYHCWIISDFMDPDGLAHLEKRLKESRGFTPVRIYEPEELEPRLETEVRLIDAESGREIVVNGSQVVVNRYRVCMKHFERLLTLPAGRIGSRVYTFSTALKVPELIRECGRELFPGGGRR